MKKLSAGLVWAWLLLGCQSSTGTDGNSLALTHGLIMNTCGPTDGPETRVLLADHGLQCAAPQLPYFTARVEGLNLNWLSVGEGHVYQDSNVQLCDSVRCQSAGLVKFQFLDSSSQGYRIQFEIDRDGKSESRGTVLLNTCILMWLCG